MEGEHMTLEKLQQKIVSFSKVGAGHWRVTIEYRGKYYSATSMNSCAIDRLHNDEVTDMTSRYGYTVRQAFQSLYDCVKRVNHLGEFNY